MYPASLFVNFNRSKNVTLAQAQQTLSALNALMLLNPSAKSQIYGISFTQGPEGAPYATIDQIDGIDPNGLYYFNIGSQLPNQASPDFWEVAVLMQIMSQGGVSAVQQLGQQMSYNASGYVPPQPITSIANLPGVAAAIDKVLWVTVAGAKT